MRWMFWKKKVRQPLKVEREIWYEFIADCREWDAQWQNHLTGFREQKPRSKDEFIDEMIKRYKISEREEKHT